MDLSPADSTTAVLAAPASTGGARIDGAPSAGAADPAGAPSADGGAAERFRTALDGVRRRFDTELAGWIAGKRAAWAAELPGAEELPEAVAALAAGGGKRLRPALVETAWRLSAPADAAAEPPAGVRALAAAVELLHTYLLIHDDIMDHAPTRRGEPSAWAAFAARHRERGWRGDPHDFGVTAAILAGDLAHTWAHERLHEACRELPSGAGGARRRAALAAAFAGAAEEVLGGQYLEIGLGVRAEGTAEELARVLRMKSGRYTMERPLELGAIYAGTPPRRARALARYGRAVGEAFQLHDDVLGTFGEADEVGKPVGGDLAEGKLTFLVFHALREGEPERAERLRRGLGRPDLDPAEAEELRATIRDSGALARVRGMIDERLAAARSAFAELGEPEDGEPPADREALAFLGGLVDYVAERRT